MKNAIAVVLVFALAALCGCQTSSSPRGGSVVEGEGFKVAVPMFTTEIKQGEVQSVAISLERGNYFRQDVKLKIEASKGISVDPTTVMVKASDIPDVQVRIAAARDAALGEYTVAVTGTPATGEPTSTVFNVKVVSP